MPFHLPTPSLSQNRRGHQRQHQQRNGTTDSAIRPLLNPGHGATGGCRRPVRPRISAHTSQPIQKIERIASTATVAVVTHCAPAERPRKQGDRHRAGRPAAGSTQSPTSPPTPLLQRDADTIALNDGVCGSTSRTAHVRDVKDQRIAQVDQRTRGLRQNRSR